MKRNEIFAVSRHSISVSLSYTISLNEQVKAKLRQVLGQIMLRETNESNYNTQANIKQQISEIYTWYF